MNRYWSQRAVSMALMQMRYARLERERERDYRRYMSPEYQGSSLVQSIMADIRRRMDGEVVN